MDRLKKFICTGYGQATIAIITILICLSSVFLEGIYEDTAFSLTVYIRMLK